MKKTGKTRSNSANAILFFPYSVPNQQRKDPCNQWKINIILFLFF